MQRWSPAKALERAALVLAVCLFLTQTVLSQPLPHEFVAYFPVLHLGSFALGMAGGYAFASYYKRWLTYRWGFRLVGVGGLAAMCVLLLSRGELVALAHNGLLAPFYLLSIIGLALSTQDKPLLGRGPLPWLGEISYGMYILHIPLALFAYGPAARLAGMVGVDPFWVQLSILLIVSAAAYQRLEIPARRLIRGKRTPPPLVEVTAERAIGIAD